MIVLETIFEVKSIEVEPPEPIDGHAVQRITVTCDDGGQKVITCHLSGKQAAAPPSAPAV